MLIEQVFDDLYKLAGDSLLEINASTDLSVLSGSSSSADRSAIGISGCCSQCMRGLTAPRLESTVAALAFNRLAQEDFEKHDCTSGAH